VWSRDGKELFFISADRKLMASAVKAGAKFEAGVPRALFEVNMPANPTPTFDVSADGRFLLPALVGGSGAGPMTVVINWTGALKR